MPGDNRTVLLKYSDVWGEVSPKLAAVKIQKFLKNAPEGLRLKTIWDNTILLDWDPHIQMQGKVITLGNFKIQVAKTKLINTHIVGNKITFKNTNCFKDLRNFQLTLIEGKVERLKKIKFYEVISDSDGYGHFIDQSINRVSCLFTANLKLNRGNTYQMTLPKIKGSIKETRLFSAVDSLTNASFIYGAEDYFHHLNWSANWYGISLILERRSPSNLYFIGQ